MMATMTSTSAYPSMGSCALSSKGKAQASVRGRFSLSSVMQSVRQEDLAGWEASVGSTAGPLRRTAKETRSIVASEVVDQLFHVAKLRVVGPGRWNRLFLSAAKCQEAKHHRLRETIFTAAALDDVEELARLKDEVPASLWKWWAYDLGLAERAAKCCRPQQVAVLPQLHGELLYPTAERVAQRRAAIEARPKPGSVEGILERQRGEVILAPLRLALECNVEIDTHAIRDALDDPISGKWKASDLPAHGVNYGCSTQKCAGWRPLHFTAATVAARRTSVTVARMLLDAKADTTLPDASGGTALHMACSQEHIAMMMLLLEFGAPIEAKDKIGCTAFQTAARARKAEVVRKFIAFVLPVDAADEVLKVPEEKLAQQFSPTAGLQLHVEVGKGAVMTVRALALEGDGSGNALADVNFPDSLGRRPLHTAVQLLSGDDKAADMVRVLARLRADLNACDCEGKTALHVAVKHRRLPVIRDLLSLRSHPCTRDNSGCTPLMLAALAPHDDRECPVYDGVPVNHPVPWRVVEDILQWDGKGEAPGPKSRRPPSALAATLEELAAADSTGPNFQAVKHDGKAHLADDIEEEAGSGPEDSAEQQNASEGERSEGSGSEAEDSGHGFIFAADAARRRAIAVAALGFDDQKILDSEGRVNRGDKLHLFKALFPKDRSAKALTDVTAKRLRLLWSKLMEPLLQLEAQGSLAPRLGELLRYVLMTVCGPRGPVFGLLAAADASGSGLGKSSLPGWGSFDQLLTDCEDVETRCSALYDFAFRDRMPKRALWVGSTWNRDEYPREPDVAPWAGFQYVTRDTAHKLNERNDNKSDEAFKGTMLPVFEPAPSEDAPLVPQRGDRLQLSNRIYVDEGLGLRLSPWDEVPHVLRERSEGRLRLVGERLICPLLEEAAAALATDATPAARAAAAAHCDILKYAATQTVEPSTSGESGPWEVMYQPFEAAWRRARHAVATSLTAPAAPRLALLTKHGVVYPMEATRMHQHAAVQPFRQGALLDAADLGWLEKRQSTRAFIALRRCGAVRSADDFNDIIAGLVALCPKAFGERFWYLAFCLLLWGRGLRLQPFFEEQLRQRLASLAGVQLRHLKLRTRQDLLQMAAQHSNEATTRQVQPENAHADGFFLVAGPDVAPGVVGIKWHSLPPNPLVIDSVKPRSWALEAGFKKGDEVLEINGMRGSELTEDGFWRAMKNRPIRFKVRKRYQPFIERLPLGLTDMLRAEILCENEHALSCAFDALQNPAASVANQRKTSAFHLLQVTNGFHQEQCEHVFPRAASVVLTFHLGARQPGPEKLTIQQYVEVELLLPGTAEARWLARYMKLSPAEDGPPRVRSPGHPNGFGPRRRQPLY